jgi:hypothetical protein
MTEYPSPFPIFEPRDADVMLFKSYTPEVKGRQT